MAEAWLEEEPRLWREPTGSSTPHAGRQRRKALLERMGTHKASKRLCSRLALPELFAYPAKELVMHVLKLPTEIRTLPWAGSPIKAVLKTVESHSGIFAEEIGRTNEAPKTIVATHKVVKSHIVSIPPPQIPVRLGRPIRPGFVPLPS